VDRVASGRVQRVELERGGLLVRGDACVTDEARFGEQDDLGVIEPGEMHSWGFLRAPLLGFGLLADFAPSVDTGTTVPL